MAISPKGKNKPKDAEPKENKRSWFFLKKGKGESPASEPVFAKESVSHSTNELHTAEGDADVKANTGKSPQKVLSFLSGVYLENKSSDNNEEVFSRMEEAKSGAKVIPLILGVRKNLVAEFIEGLLTKFLVSPKSVELAQSKEDEPSSSKKKSLTIETL